MHVFVYINIQITDASCCVIRTRLNMNSFLFPYCLYGRFGWNNAFPNGPCSNCSCDHSSQWKTGCAMSSAKWSSDSHFAVS